MRSNNVGLKLRVVATVTAGISFLALVAASSAGQHVELSAGSVDGLAAAIASAGPDGTVLVKAGAHTESGTVVISVPVNIIGEPDAVIKCGTSPGGTVPIPVIATLDIQNTKNVLVQGLQFQPSGAAANCAVLIENSSGVQVLDNTITGFEFGVVLQYADQSSIRGNTVSGGSFCGILIVNGVSALVSDNAVSEAEFGIFTGDQGGVASRNNVSACLVGMILCHMFPDILDISGDTSGAHTRCNGWHVEGNTALGNAWGYEVIDGSYNNLLVNNAASNNSEYDIELAGDTTRYGSFAPASHDDVVIAGSQKDLLVKDCGSNDVIHGEVSLVDHSADPCD
jgi:parallel beta-helix repeat protein